VITNCGHTVAPDRALTNMRSSKGFGPSHSCCSKLLMLLPGAATERSTVDCAAAGASVNRTMQQHTAPEVCVIAVEGEPHVTNDWRNHPMVNAKGELGKGARKKSDPTLLILHLETNPTPQQQLLNGYVAAESVLTRHSSSFCTVHGCFVGANKLHWPYA
jgi:hypothetical protein